jgi:hypothetical protein
VGSGSWVAPLLRSVAMGVPTGSFSPGWARMRSSTPASKISISMAMKTLPRVSGEMALHVLVYNLTRVINMGSRLLVAAIRA